MLKLPQNSMERILKDITGFIQDMLLDLFDNVKSKLMSIGVDPSSVPGLSLLFAEDSIHATPFKKLETHHMQMKYYKETLGLVVSQ